jgi:hypothetical protein
MHAEYSKPEESLNLVFHDVGNLFTTLLSISPPDEILRLRQGKFDWKHTLFDDVVDSHAVDILRVIYNYGQKVRVLVITVGLETAVPTT